MEPRVIGVYVLAVVLSAIVWWLLTQLIYVPIAIVLTEGAALWFRRSQEPNPWYSVIATEVFLGGTYAAIGMLVWGSPQ